jgi:hypothetical protein
LRSEVLTSLTIKISAFWNVPPCSLVNVYQCLGKNCCLLLQGTSCGFIYIWFRTSGLDVHGRIVLKWMIEKWGVRARVGFSCLRICTTGGLLITPQGTFVFSERRITYLLVNRQSVSQEEPCSVEFLLRSLRSSPDPCFQYSALDFLTSPGIRRKFTNRRQMMRRYCKG